MNRKVDSFDMLLTQELTNLERFIVKSPLGSDEFWSEWQAKTGEIIVTKAAIKRALRVYRGRLSQEQITKLSSMLEAFKEIAGYLELLRQTALKVRGIDVSEWDILGGIEGESEGEDDLPF
ncbi:hypothetical protein GWK41_08755 [Persephonella atlantica]|uniref:Uncharacterized protein n=1 Tax=Persephonella atlantica TaxID=2699429 RepID=A0ABS1GJP2_9AQUI|nr:hypothetical protein [Persephonella atlantica]MBK3333159.1 hypothetical protein [Persephonella atlantica]